MIKINEIEIPQNITELSWAAYKRIVSLNEFDTLNVLAAVTGVEKSVLESTAYTDFPFFLAIETINDWLNSENLKSLSGFDISHLVSGFNLWEIKGGQIAQAFDLGSAKLSPNEQIESLVAIFQLGNVSKKKDLENTEAWKILSLHAFFLSNWEKLAKTSSQSHASTKALPKKSKRIQNLFKGSGFGGRLTNWLKGIF